MSDKKDHVKMFGPLNFKDLKPKVLDKRVETPCLLCSDLFNIKLCFDVFLKHLFEVHFVVIEDVQNIYNLPKYVDYWKGNFDKCSIESLVPAVAIEGTAMKYYLLSGLIEEDRELRKLLELDRALDMQEYERTDKNFKRNCLFCRLEYEGTRADYLTHLSQQHNLQLGNPQNLVFTDELLERIETTLDSLHCLYCDKTFPDRSVLKEHMRKKIHKRINSQNTSYDKYYMINYVEDKKRVKSLDGDEDAIELGEQNSDSEYSDWREGDDLMTCLYCEHTEINANRICLHMQTVHKFNFYKVAAHLDFYQRVKLVNYVRRQMHLKQCPYCNEEFEVMQDLVVHLKAEGHCKLPDVEKFDQPEFYFPTYENDTFLYYLEDLD